MGHLFDIPLLRQFSIGEILPIKRAVSTNALAIGALQEEVEGIERTGVTVYAENGVVKFGSSENGGGE